MVKYARKQAISDQHVPIKEKNGKYYEDSVLIRKNPGQRKPVFWHILSSAFRSEKIM